MYIPVNIKITIPNYYNIKNNEETILHKEDFGNDKYIINRLNESGILTREQLNRHLEAGWYYLWTIPGIGEASRQKILKALDKLKYSFHSIIIPYKSYYKEQKDLKRIVYVYNKKHKLETKTAANITRIYLSDIFIKNGKINISITYICHISKEEFESIKKKHVDMMYK